VRHMVAQYDETFELLPSYRWSITDCNLVYNATKPENFGPNIWNILYFQHVWLTLIC